MEGVGRSRGGRVGEAAAASSAPDAKARPAEGDGRRLTRSPQRRRQLARVQPTSASPQQPKAPPRAAESAPGERRAPAEGGRPLSFVSAPLDKGRAGEGAAADGAEARAVELELTREKTELEESLDLVCELRAIVQQLSQRLSDVEKEKEGLQRRLARYEEQESVSTYMQLMQRLATDGAEASGAAPHSASGDDAAGDRPALVRAATPATVFGSEAPTTAPSPAPSAFSVTNDGRLRQKAAELLRDKRRAEFHAQLLEQQVLHLNAKLEEADMTAEEQERDTTERLRAQEQRHRKQLRDLRAKLDAATAQAGEGAQNTAATPASSDAAESAAAQQEPSA